MRISDWSSDVCSSDLLPPADELVLVSGLPPIRAKKLRYYEDYNFRSRVAAAPMLAEKGYCDRPPARTDDWTGQVRGTDARLAAAADRELGLDDGDEEGGLQQQRQIGSASCRERVWQYV